MSDDLIIAGNLVVSGEQQQLIALTWSYKTAYMLANLLLELLQETWDYFSTGVTKATPLFSDESATTLKYQTLKIHQQYIHILLRQVILM